MHYWRTEGAAESKTTIETERNVQIDMGPHKDGKIKMMWYGVCGSGEMKEILIDSTAEQFMQLIRRDDVSGWMQPVRRWPT